MTPAELLMKLSLAEADIQFAKAKCCQAELALEMGLAEARASDPLDPERARRSLYEQEMDLAKEAAERAREHLAEIKP